MVRECYKLQYVFMKIHSLLILIAFLALILSLPAGFAQGADTKKQQTPDKPWTWPLPPEKPRVQHTRTFITPEDLGVKKGFFAKLWEFVAGKDTADRILSPHGIAADGRGKVYVVDWGSASIHYFDFTRKIELDFEFREFSLARSFQCQLNIPFVENWDSINGHNICPAEVIRGLLG